MARATIPLHRCSGPCGRKLPRALTQLAELAGGWVELRREGGPNNVRLATYTGRVLCEGCWHELADDPGEPLPVPRHCAECDEPVRWRRITGGWVGALGAHHLRLPVFAPLGLCDAHFTASLRGEQGSLF